MESAITESGTDINRAAMLLLDDALVAIPTETVYGLAGNAFSPSAVTRIFQTKNRPVFDPLIVHTHSLEEIRGFVTVIPPVVERLIEEFSPGPLTVLLPRNHKIPDLVTSGLPLVAVRIPRHPMTLELLRALPFPLAAPSANPFGYISPTTARHVLDQLGGKIPYVLDGGSCEVGVESTIVGFNGSRCEIYREGGISQEQLMAICGPLGKVYQSSSSPSAPGMLLSHYAPRKTLYLGNLDALLERFKGVPVGVLSYDTPVQAPNILASAVLSPEGDLSAAAQRLFACLRDLDQSRAQVLLAESVPDQGLGRAINDRLQRAAIKEA